MSMEAPFSWREELGRNPVWAPEFTLDPERTALVIVDLQNITTNPGGSGLKYLSTYYPEAAEGYLARLQSFLLPNVKRLLAHFREQSLRIIYVTVGSQVPDGTDFEPLRRSSEKRIHHKTGMRTVLTDRSRDDFAIMAELAPRPEDLVINKVSRSAFTTTGIDQILRNMGMKGLVFTGVATNACVGLTACDAGDRGYKTVIVEDAVASSNTLLHEAALLNFASLYGQVWTTDQVFSALSADG